MKLEQKKKLLFCMLVAFLWGCVSHAYAFFNLPLAHDSLNEFFAGVEEDAWKISLGRVFVPVYRQLVRGPYTAPWLIGMLGMLWIGIAVYLIQDVFQRYGIFDTVLLSGILVSNISVTALIATYLHDLDFNMFAMLLAVWAFWLWNKGGWWILLGALATTVSLGIYQSYVSVTITLIMLWSILQLLRDQKVQAVFVSGLKAMGMLLCGAGLYLVSVKLVCSLTGVPLRKEGYNSLTNVLSIADGRALVSAIRDVYDSWWCAFSEPITVDAVWPMVLANKVLVFFVMISICILVLNKRLRVLAVGLILGLGALLPLGMNLTRLLNKGVTHHLMVYAFFLLYFFADSLKEELKKLEVQSIVQKLVKPLRCICTVVLVLALWNNVKVSNAAYLYRNITQQTTLSVMTRVVDRMEQQPDYIAGQTPVAFIGKTSAQTRSEFASITGITGFWQETALQTTYLDTYPKYFRYILNEPLQLCSDETLSSIRQNDAVQQMPVFPAEGCVQMMNGVLVVKFS